MTTPLPLNYVYDIETFRALFCAVIVCPETNQRWIFEVSRRRDNSTALIESVRWIGQTGGNMVGFNNEAFDYVVLHAMANTPGWQAYDAYLKAQQLIQSQDTNRFGETIWPNKRLARQIDLFKIHHFDNKARSTSLKALEFNMRLPWIEEPPYDLLHAEYLTDEQIDETIAGCAYDVGATVEFWRRSAEQIAFREKLSAEYEQDWINANDTKIGKQYFIMRLEQQQPGTCYTRGPGGRQPRQTPRESIALADVILPSVSFRMPEFASTLDWFKSQTITNTKDAFGTDKESKELTRVSVRGFPFVFGTGGIHGSIKRKAVRATATHDIVDVDVASYYPNLAIANRLYPAHLGEMFADIYEQVYQMRKQYPKDDPVNGVLKLALNGVYGDSNNPYSPFYDPQYTMSITINGQLLLCMLAETVMLYTTAEMIQINTDGMTIRIPKSERDILTDCLKAWETHTRLEIESVDYECMFIRDVNNYIARTTGGKVKRKGAYETANPDKRKPIGWHQDCGGLVVPKVAERVMLDGADALTELINWRDPYDFMLRCKTGRESKLIDSAGGIHGRVTRYHIARDGVTLTKHMPKTTARIEKGWFVNVCNDASSFDWRTLELRWYLNEISKLVIDESLS